MQQYNLQYNANALATGTLTHSVYAHSLKQSRAADGHVCQTFVAPNERVWPRAVEARGHGGRDPEDPGLYRR